MPSDESRPETDGTETMPEPGSTGENDTAGVNDRAEGHLDTEGAAGYQDVPEAEAITIPTTAAADAPSGRRSAPFRDKRSIAIVAILILILLAVAWEPGMIGFIIDNDESDNDSPVKGNILWDEPVWLPRNPACVDPDNGQEFPEFAIGYEPSIAVDPSGNLYYTAHKDLRWCAPGGGPLSGSPYPPLPCVQGYSTTWDYYASWFFVSRDGGKTWGPPDDWGAADYGSEYPGDEGDIGVDDTGTVYFVDTTLEDDWLHIWRDGGTDYVNGQRLQSMTADDRPWVTAQGNGIVHYLGNNGVPVPGMPLSSGTSGVGRYWYYRGEMDPTDSYVVFDQGRALEGGWAHITAEPNGDHVYIAQESNEGSGGIQVWVSDDTGVTWRDPVIVGPMNGTHPEGYPWMGVGEDGAAFVAWQESPQGGRAPGNLYIARSDDYGRTWKYWNITGGHPHDEGGVYLYPNLEVGPGNLVAYTYYGNIGAHTAGDQWHLYAAALRDPQPGEIFDFRMVDPHPLYTSSEQDAQTDDLHPLHDFFEVTVSPVDSSINIAYQYNIGEHPFEDGEEQRYLMFVRGEWVGDEE